MQYRVVPKNGDKLSVLGFGCMRLPTKGQTIDEEQAIKQIRLAIDNGVNYVDTAPSYHGGESETVLGKALKDGYRDRVKVATKLTPFMLQRLEDMEKMLNASLKKLQTDHIDYYLLHALEHEFWKKLQGFGVIKFLKNAKAEGKIVNMCFSFHDSLPVFKEIIAANDWAMCQIQYNYLDERLQAGTEGLRYAAKEKVAVAVMEPLRGGSLAAKLPAESKRVFDASPIKRSSAEWGLRWVWNHPEVTLALSGMNEESQVVENLRTAETALPNSLKQEELATVKSAADAYRKLLKVPCTSCQYCMPCINGVNIPRNFQSYNEYYLSGDPEHARSIYVMFLMGALSGVRGDASLCKKCKVCVEHCPQHINIPEKLAEVEAELGGAKAEAALAAMKANLSQVQSIDKKP